MKKGNESESKEQAVVIPHCAEEPGGPGQQQHQGNLLHHQVSAEKARRNPRSCVTLWLTRTAATKRGYKDDSENKQAESIKLTKKIIWLTL